MNNLFVEEGIRMIKKQKEIIQIERRNDLARAYSEEVEDRRAEREEILNWICALGIALGINFLVVLALFN